MSDEPLSAASLAAALQREHREVDEAIEAFAADPSRAGAPQALAAAATAMRRHIYLEEEFLFPLVHANADADQQRSILVMLREHATIWNALGDLEGLVALGAASDVPVVCRRLLVTLMHHNLAEERIVYSQLEHLLPRQAAPRIAGFLESGALPEGWVCIRARGS